MGLRSNSSGNRSKWTDLQLIEGFTHFKLLYGRYPSAGEIDKFDGLPSSRSIQRSHGGLISLRKRLFPDIEDYNLNLTKGITRSNKAKEADLRAKKYEEVFYNELCSRFDSISIHEQKRIRPGDVSADVYLYLNKDDGIVIDLFYAQDIKTLGKIVTIKSKRYHGLRRVIFVLVGNDLINQKSIDSLIANKAHPLSNEITVMNENTFWNYEIKKIMSESNYSI
jgi:hypothetical protein